MGRYVTLTALPSVRLSAVVREPNLTPFRTRGPDAHAGEEVLPRRRCARRARCLHPTTMRHSGTQLTRRVHCTSLHFTVLHHTLTIHTHSLHHVTRHDCRRQCLVIARCLFVLALSHPRGGRGSGAPHGCGGTSRPCLFTTVGGTISGLRIFETSFQAQHDAALRDARL